MTKTIFITGSTTGIGKLAAIRFAQAGHKVYLHGRTPEKLANAIKEVKSQADHAQVEGFVADLSDLEAVRDMAQEIAEALPNIEVLINNAGVFKSTAPLNQAGLDMRYVVNYLAHYVLTDALLPLLHQGTDPRILNLSSAAQAPIAYDILTGKAQGSERSTYAQSKLALTMWSFHLAQTQADISIIAVNPGSLLNTRMVQEAFGHHWAPADKGADILYDLALSDAYKGMTGKYFDNDQGSFGMAHADAYEAKGIQRLISVTDALVSTESSQ